MLCTVGRGDSLACPHDAEAMEWRALKRENNFVQDRLDVRNKGEGAVKSNAEELGNGVKCKEGPSQSELGVMRSLIGAHTEEAAFTFSEVDWDAPFQRPFFKVIEGLLNRVGSFQRFRGGRPDGKIISIE